ncbi:hypothetical protein FF38_13014 [Lucilia cuprina]|uniref:Uncharacterized protein n=1 Tax=Lucilia cuprina TaxID=7375 RepID=A0A0L0C3K9_LUCCU|nr:hypothetical protein FF38_13014 [Lucilia cuprina]
MESTIYIKKYTNEFSLSILFGLSNDMDVGKKVLNISNETWSLDKEGVNLHLERKKILDKKYYSSFLNPVVCEIASTTKFSSSVVGVVVDSGTGVFMLISVASTLYLYTAMKIYIHVLGYKDVMFFCVSGISLLCSQNSAYMRLVVFFGYFRI